MDGTLRELGLELLAECNPFDLSNGERERAALAAVLAGYPPVLLLHEPTRGMDYGRKAELAALLATHDVDLVAACADRVIVLEDGGIAAHGTPREVLTSRPGFATQIHQAFGGRCLAPEDVLEPLGLNVAVAAPRLARTPNG